MGNSGSTESPTQTPLNPPAQSPQVLALSKFGTSNTTDVGVDLAKTLLLSSMFDSQSSFAAFPKDVVRSILLLFVPSADGRYLLHKPLCRSYYQICRMIMRREEPYRSRYQLSTTAYDSRLPSQINLVEDAPQVLRFLIDTQANGIVFKQYTRDRMAELFKEYTVFFHALYSKENTATTPLIPSLEIQALWLSHMLQSADYFLLANRLTYSHENSQLGLCFEFVCHTALLPHTVDRKSCEARTENLLSELQYSRNESVYADLLEAINVGFTPEMAIDDQYWIGEFLNFNQGIDYNSQKFLESAHLGYQRMMYLKWKCSADMEALGFAPCPSIDLIWHSHLLRPGRYHADMRWLLGHAPAHKLLKEEQRTLVNLSDRENKEEAMWQKAFKESMFVYGMTAAC